MIVNRIEGATHVLGKPKDWEEGSCLSLPIRVELTEDGPVMVSSWQPTPEEIIKIYAGAPILLYVHGQGHPPVMLTVGDMPK